MSELSAGSARAAINEVAGEFTELSPSGSGPPGRDGPLGWPGYDAAVERARQRGGDGESVVYGHATIGGVRTVVLAFDFRYLGGSVGRRTGERIEHAFTEARAHGRPVVSMIASGGSRLQEGMLALTQLQRIAAQCLATRAAGLAHVAVLRDPTTGGVWATLGAGADVVLAESGARVGFAGRRVRPAEDADHPVFTAEGQVAAGHVDAIVHTGRLRDVLAGWLVALTGRWQGPADVPRALGATALPADGMAAVLAARSAARPRAGAYLADYFDTYELISGDRCGGVDPGTLCGFGRRAGRSIAFAAQAGTPTTPAGFRTATRLVRLADRLGIPVLTLVDTPGAANGSAAEAAGLAPAIAGLFAAMSAATVPITTLVIGEGGSGGALALAAEGRTWITPDAYFSVIAPEAAAAILGRPAADVASLANALRLRPQDLVELGVVQGIAGQGGVS